MGWSEEDIPDLEGRIAVVTGANSGIGFETARALAEHGARVILGCRDKGRGLDALERIRETAPRADLAFYELDLASLESTANFASSVAADAGRIDVLVNNAGVMVPPYGKTEDGFELQFGVNHLGHFALTGRCLNLLRRSRSARVVTVSSIAHVFGRMNFKDLQSEKRYVAPLAYGQSKLANLLFTLELQKKFDRAGMIATSLAAHPGTTDTNLQQHSLFFRGFVKVFSQDAASGALPSLYAATSPEIEPAGYYGPGGIGEMVGAPKPARRTLRAKDRKTAAQLWEVSERLTGVRYDI